MNDLMKRLRGKPNEWISNLRMEAADYIEDLRSFNVRLQNQCDRATSHIDVLEDALREIAAKDCDGELGIQAIAWRALEGKHD